MSTITGLGVSRGIGVGRVVFYRDQRKSSIQNIGPHEIPGEVERFRSAHDTCRRQLVDLSSVKETDSGRALSGIFGAHLLILDDPLFVDSIVDGITRTGLRSESALHQVCDRLKRELQAATSDNFREKALDIDDVCTRLTAVLSDPEPAYMSYEHSVVVARDLRPSAILEIARHRPAAFVTERGGWTSHSSILARELRIPMVAGIEDVFGEFASEQSLVVNGITGEISPGTTGNSAAFSSARTATIVGNDPVVPITTDGIEITIRANSDLVDSYTIGKSHGARGVGLFRSESLIRDGGFLPSEDEQVRAYAAMADAAGDYGVRIRTFDHEEGHLRNSRECNAAMGLRSIRLSLSEPDQFRTQIRVLLRASAGRRIDIVIPMVSGPDEIVRVQALIEDERQSLTASATAFGSPAIGAMIELPAAVISASAIIEKVGFVCLGTNDLVQYLLAVDRDNPAVAEWYQSLHPSVLWSIKRVVEAAASAGKPLAICGEIAGSPFYVPLLIGLGARELSVNVDSIAQITHLIANVAAEDCRRITQTSLSSTTAHETEALLRDFYLSNWAQFFPPGLLDARHR